MAYIKLGPRGKSFTSKKYNIYLSPGIATVAKESVIYGDLAKFIITGYFVEITKNEYENLRLNFNNNPTVNSLTKGINTITNVEPVLDIITEAPDNPKSGDRYIIGDKAIGNWLGQDDYIIEYNGFSWDISKPEDGMIVPLINRGIAATYVGTYPSGKWVFNPDDEDYYINEVLGQGDVEDGDQTITINLRTLYQMILQEIEDRGQGDMENLNALNTYISQQSRDQAVNILVDTNGTYTQLGENVQISLQKLYDSFTTNKTSIESLIQRLNSLEQLLNTPGNSTLKLTEYHLYIGVDTIEYEHNLGYYPHIDFYEVLDTDQALGALPDLEAITVQPLLVKPYRANGESVNVYFPRLRDILMVITKKV